MKDDIRIPEGLIENIYSDIDAVIESGEDDWDEETRKDWEEKMADIGKGKKLTEKELEDLIKRRGY